MPTGAEGGRSQFSREERKSGWCRRRQKPNEEVWHSTKKLSQIAKSSISAYIIKRRLFAFLFNKYVWENNEIRTAESHTRERGNTEISGWVRKRGKEGLFEERSLFGSRVLLSPFFLPPPSISRELFSERQLSLSISCLSKSPVISQPALLLSGLTDGTGAHPPQKKIEEKNALGCGKGERVCFQSALGRERGRRRRDRRGRYTTKQ